MTSDGSALGRDAWGLELADAHAHDGDERGCHDHENSWSRPEMKNQLEGVEVIDVNLPKDHPRAPYQRQVLKPRRKLMMPEMDDQPRREASDHCS